MQNLLIGADRQAQRLTPVTMADLGWRERADLQRWIRAHPDILERDLLLVSEEASEWEGADAPVHDRLDLLFIDPDGRLLVVELKRGAAPDRTESQALGYAAYCDQLTTADVVDWFARTHDLSSDEAKKRVEEHAPALTEQQPGKVRVRLVAEDFPSSVTSSVMFLRELGSGGPESSMLDIGCIKLTAYALPDGSHVVSAQPLIPIPETEEYLVKRRKRQADDDSNREERTRAVNATILLLRENAIVPGTPLRVRQGWFSAKDQQAIDELLAREPEWGELTWLGGENQGRAVQASWNEEPVSVNGHHHEMRARAGLGGQPGATHAWTVGDTGLSLREFADLVEAGHAPAAPELAAQAAPEP